MSNSRGFVGILHRITGAQPKHDAANGTQYPSSPGPDGSRDEPDGSIVRPDPQSQEETSPEYSAHPVPLRPGEVIELPNAEPQEHLFAFKAGDPLPNRSSKATPWAAVPLAPVASGGPAVVPGRSALPGNPAETLKRYRAAITPEPKSPVPEPKTPTPVRKDFIVTNVETILKEAMQIDGAIGVSLVDYTSGMTLGQAGGSNLNMDVASAGNTEVVRAKLRTIEALGLRDGIEDILITLDTQYHLIRLITDRSGVGLFLYLALNKQKANLAMARRKLANLEQQIEV